MMLLHVDLRARRDLARQIHRQIRAAIIDGIARPGERLPATRDLARQLGVSRNTVTAAYEWLIADGLVEGRAGAGTRVASFPDVRPAPARGRQPDIAMNPFYRSNGTPVAVRRHRYDLRVGVPDIAAFPVDQFRRALVRGMRRSAFADYGEIAGDMALRHAIARHVAGARGVRAAPDAILVTAGAQQAFALLADVLMAPGTRVAVEEPGYGPLRRVIASRGARMAGVPVDGEGLVVDALPADARVVCVTPSHQFPLGMTMSHRRRMALLDWASRRGATIVEDDYDSEFRFGDRPLEALHSLDRGGRVVYVGTFSKSLLPSLRLGYMVAPLPLHEALVQARALADWGGNGPIQAALADFLDTGAFSRHVRRMRGRYAARHELVRRFIVDELAPAFVPIPATVGLHLTARLARPSLSKERALVAAAARRDVGVLGLSGFFGTPRRQAGLVLGYGVIDFDDLQAALRLLAGAAAECRVLR